jgi:hypothetical protein
MAPTQRRKGIAIYFAIAEPMGRPRLVEPYRLHHNSGGVSEELGQPRDGLK